MIRKWTAFAVAAALVGSALAGAAQTPEQDAIQGPRIELSPAQRQTIYQSVAGTQKNQAAPPGFRVSVGGTAPLGVDFSRLSDTVTTLVPQAGKFEAAMVEKQVVLIEPQTGKVAAVIREEEQ